MEISKEDYEDILNQLDELRYENRQLKQKIEGLVDNIHEMVRINELEFPNGGV